MRILQISAKTKGVSAPRELARMWLAVSALTVLGLVLLMANQGASGSPMLDSVPQESSQQAGEYNNYANLISAMLDDAGNLHKKSKMSSMRQIKQTLRFGRRSDPLMAPGFDGERLEANANANDHEQRRLLALDMD